MCSKAYLFTISVFLLFIPTNLQAQSYIYWGDKKYESKYVGSFQKYYGNSMNPIRVDDISMEIGRKTNGGAILLLEISNRINQKIAGTVYLFLENGQRIKCIDRNLNDKVNSKLRALYFLTPSEVQELKRSNIVKIRYSLSNYGRLESYTASYNLNTTKDFVELFGNNNSKTKRSTRKNKSFHSNRYSYSLEIPSGFSKIDNRSPNMDMNFSADDGSSINMVVIPLTSQFERKKTDDLTETMILNIFKRIDPNAIIEGSDHVMVNGKKSFYYTLVFSPENASYNLKQLTYTFYKDGNRFIITMTSGVDSFSNHKADYQETAESIKF